MLLLNGKIFHKTQITRKSIGKIDNQMSSDIELLQICALVGEQREWFNAL